MYIGFRRTLVQAVRYRPQLYRESPGAGRRNGETDNVREAERILCIQSRTHAMREGSIDVKIAHDPTGTA